MLKNDYCLTTPEGNTACFGWSWQDREECINLLSSWSVCRDEGQFLAKFSEALHALCALAYNEANDGVVRELLSDVGAIHEAAHYLHLTGEPLITRQRVQTAVRKFLDEFTRINHDSGRKTKAVVIRNYPQSPHWGARREAASA